jgi:transposase-like protein
VKVVTAEDAAQAPLPPRVQEALGQLVGAAKEGLLALSVGVGLGVLSELMEEEVEEVEEVVGPTGKHDADRVAVRHGHEDGEVTLGGRRVGVKRPRVRSANGEAEVPLAAYRHFADRDPLSRLVLEQMLAGVSTRRFGRTREPVGSEVEASARSTSKSSVSRDFVAKTKERLIGLMSRRLDDVRLAALMLDGIELKGRFCVVALGITTDGVKIPLGLWDGSTENATVARELLTNLVTRGLDLSQGVLCVIDGAPRRSGRRSSRCLGRCPSSAASATRSATCSTTSPSATVPRSSTGCGEPGLRTTTITRSRRPSPSLVSESRAA